MFRAVELAFGRGWEDQIEVEAGIRVVIATHPTAPGPCAFYAVLVQEGEQQWVELIDVIVDEEYDWGA